MLGYIVVLLAAGCQLAAAASASWSVTTERPLMVNSLNAQRKAVHAPLLCQDAQLTSTAQQYAQILAQLEYLNDSIPSSECNQLNLKADFCNATQRLAAFGTASENIASLSSKSGSASTAMAQFNANPVQYGNMLNARFLYVGIGMAQSSSGKYYWVQMFSMGNFKGVSCTDSPMILLQNASQVTAVVVQPPDGLNYALYPVAQPKVVVNGTRIDGLFCTLLPNIPGRPIKIKLTSESTTKTTTLPLPPTPYPTMVLPFPHPQSRAIHEISKVVSAFIQVLSVASATIVGPTSIPNIPMTVSPSVSSSDSISSLSTNTFSIDLNATISLSSGSPFSLDNSTLSMTSLSMNPMSLTTSLSISPMSLTTSLSMSPMSLSMNSMSLGTLAASASTSTGSAINSSTSTSISSSTLLTSSQ